MMGLPSGTTFRFLFGLTSKNQRRFSVRAVQIGDIERGIRPDLSAEQKRKIPSGYLSKVQSEDPYSHAQLQWLMKKDLLGQDALLVSANSSIHSRRLALAYAELTERPVEVLVVSRDTTDSDLKQRRVLSDGDSPEVLFLDQAPVRAARHGHTLILDGLQYAERNVLASLNNLLENREMPLEDGTILSSTHKSSNRYVPVHPEFRVIALYNVASSEESLDPPVRSRFSIRHVKDPEVDNSLAIVREVVESASTYALSSITQLQSLFPHHPTASFLARRYPLFKDDASQRTFRRICKEMNISHKTTPIQGDLQVKRLDDPSSTHGKFVYDLAVLPGGIDESRSFSKYISTQSSDDLLHQMLQEHAVGRHILLSAGPGTGKSIIAEQFARLLGYSSPWLFPLYSEMTSNDLFLRRGSSEVSPLIAAAVEGGICILDNVNSVSAGLLATLQSLLIDGQVWLPDGRHITAHESFRVVGLGGIRSPLATTTLDMFSVIHMGNITEQCYQQLLQPHNTYNESELAQLLDFRHQVDQDDTFASLSLRDLGRIVQQGNIMGLSESVRATMVADLMPKIRQEAIDRYLSSAGIQAKSKGTPLLKKPGPRKHEDGGYRHKCLKPDQIDLVPKPFFFSIPSQEDIVQLLLMEWSNNERSFLLLGNQGTGKNKICDRVCELLNHEREYIQLHRDSTISQLTITPSLEDGKIAWIDSALVRAVIHGRALVVDEADKAPLEVVAVLKSLVEDGQMLLADGRRILRNPSGRESDEVIPVHENFTMWVLANRPGRKFHGNDLHSSIGDCFRSHVIPNPDIDSEVELLRRYAPSVAQREIMALAKSFSDLRAMFENGDVAYPYSTREAVSVVSHLEKFPQDGITEALSNVIDLDTFDDDIYQKLRTVFEKRGVKLPASLRYQLDANQNILIKHVNDENDEAKSVSPPPLSSPKVGKFDEKNERHVGGNTWQGGTGGSDTAGLGGRGGPFRIDSGHQVHQVSEAAKAEVTEHAKQAARRIAEAAFNDRLRAIRMSKEDHATYDSFIEPIRPEIAALKSTLGNTERRKDERTWLKGQIDGELDTLRLVEGLAGERHIYKRRAKPRIHGRSKTFIRFVFDCSASMYRFGGYDQRLTRSLQAAALIMEAFDGISDDFSYSIVGHSGDSKRIELSSFNRPPANPKERLSLLQTMVAHSQYCSSGDNTISAIHAAVKDVSEFNENAIVIVLSDANFQRYGITANELKSAMRGSAKTFCIFIAGFGDEAIDIQHKVAAGNVFVCKDTAALPRTFRTILSDEIDHS